MNKEPMRALASPDLGDVTLEGGFWGSRIQTNRQVSIWNVYQQCKQSGRIDAFGLKWRPGKPSRPHHFWDSDTAKWLEGACLCMIGGGLKPMPRLRKLVNQVAELIASAQQDDGYLNTYFTATGLDKRWMNLRDMHELYCAGNLMEAGVAHWRATGSKLLLGAVCGYADHIAKVFGRGTGQKRGYPGHEEIELALMKLYQATGRRRYLKLAKYFIDERGRRPHYYDLESSLRGERPRPRYEYYQAHLPVRQQRDAVGHAVRAVYLYSAMVDVAAQTHDARLWQACKSLWESIVSRKMYLTGAIGAMARNEAFGNDYDLPNRAYAETCAAIGLVHLANRMLQVEPKGQYADVLEQALYNGLLSGVSLDGRRYFYENPLVSDGSHHRTPWFNTSCCPTNLVRFFPQVGTLAYGLGIDSLYVNLYMAGQIKAKLGSRDVNLHVSTDYPWNARVALIVGIGHSASGFSRGSFAINLRIPKWCRKHSVTINGRPARQRVSNGYMKLRRLWRNGDAISLDMDMPAERVQANPRVWEDAGRVALRRGPLVYCLEQADHQADVHSIILPDSSSLLARHEPKTLGGVTVIEGDALAMATPGGKELYHPAHKVKLRRLKLRAIPYYAWDNRAPGSMVVWMHRRCDGR